MYTPREAEAIQDFFDGLDCQITLVTVLRWIREKYNDVALDFGYLLIAYVDGYRLD